MLIKAEALTKRFGSQTAVDGIDFTVDRGEVFGFLGPNGAGKTSTMRMIGCVSTPTGGSLSVLGMDPRHEGARIRGRMGVVPQENNLDVDLTVWENLIIYGRYFGMPLAEVRSRASELLDFAQLTERREDRVDPLSGGMKRRLVIARALLNRPDIVLLDEPTTGLDPQARHLLWERLYRLKREGITLVLTTHYMEEAEQLCDRLVIMDEGRIVAEGAPRQLIGQHATREVVELRYASPEEHPVAVAELRRDFEGSVQRIEALADRVVVYTDDGDKLTAAMAAAPGSVGQAGTAGHRVQPDSVLVRRASLEDVFLILTGRTVED